MPNIRRPQPPSEAAIATHVRALRLIGMHGGSFDHNCAAATCTRRAHWRYFPERNPRLAELLIDGGAYELYAVVDGDGYPMTPGTFVVLKRADGPAGSLYVDAEAFVDYRRAIRWLTGMAIASREVDDIQRG